MNPPSDTSRTRRVHRLVLLAIIAGVIVCGWGYTRLYRRGVVVDPPVPEVGRDDPAVLAALHHLRDQIAQAPQSGEAWGRYAQFLMAHRYNDEALVCLSEAERRLPLDPRWPYYRALVMSERDPGVSVVLLMRASALTDRPAPELHLRLADGYFLLDRPDDAAAEFHHVLTTEPNNARARLGLARLAHRRGDAAASSLLTPLLDHPETRKAARTLFAEVARRGGDTATAARVGTSAAALPDDPPLADPLMQQMLRFQVGREAQIQRATFLVQQGNATEAVQLLERTVEDYPDSAVAWLWLGRALLSLEHIDPAMQAVNRALALEPEFVEAHFYQGALHFQARRLTEATAAFRRAVERKPNHVLAWYNIGQCLTRSGDHKGAIAAYREALRLKPGMIDAHLALGELLLGEEPKQAREHFRLAGQIDPDHPRVRQLEAKARD